MDVALVVLLFNTQSVFYWCTKCLVLLCFCEMKLTLDCFDKWMKSSRGPASSTERHVAALVSRSQLWMEQSNSPKRKGIFLLSDSISRIYSTCHAAPAKESWHTLLIAHFQRAKNEAIFHGNTKWASEKNAYKKNTSLFVRPSVEGDRDDEE